MLVSVIIPNYNHSQFLKQRIDSVLNQTFTDFELIILDDCSNDDSRTIIERYLNNNQRVSVYYNDLNSGSPFSQWNFGVSKAQGDFVWIAESDDSADPNFLEQTVKLMNKYSYAGLVHCDSKVINELKQTEYFISEKRGKYNPDRWKKEYYCNGMKETVNEFFLENPILNVSSVLFRKKVYIESGGSEPMMKFCGDWLTYLKILQRSDIAYTPLPLSVFRLHSGSTFLSNYTSNMYLFEKIKVYSFLLNLENLSILKKIMILFRLFKTAFLRFLNFVKFYSFLLF